MIRTWLPACQLKQEFLVTSKAGTWRRKCGILFTSFLLIDFALDLAFPRDSPHTKSNWKSRSTSNISFWIYPPPKKFQSPPGRLRFVPRNPPQKKTFPTLRWLVMSQHIIPIFTPSIFVASKGGWFECSQKAVKDTSFSRFWDQHIFRTFGSIFLGHVKCHRSQDGQMNSTLEWK